MMSRRRWSWPLSWQHCYPPSSSSLSLRIPHPAWPTSWWRRNDIWMLRTLLALDESEIPDLAHSMIRQRGCSNKHLGKKWVVKRGKATTTTGSGPGSTSPWVGFRTTHPSTHSWTIGLPAYQGQPKCQVAREDSGPVGEEKPRQVLLFTLGSWPWHQWLLWLEGTNRSPYSMGAAVEICC